jgi:23S rRNA (pseudouridine1915-N3)-methyltransferase
LDQLRQDYLAKINHFTPAEHNSIKFKEKEKSSAESQLQATEKILLRIEPSDFVVTFDQRGRQLSSEEFAKQLLRISESGKQTCWWIIGGAHGISPALLKRANLKLALAPFVMSHQIAEAVALEQVYRGFTINHNLPYHNP